MVISILLRVGVRRLAWLAGLTLVLLGACSPSVSEQTPTRPSSASPTDTAAVEPSAPPPNPTASDTITPTTISSPTTTPSVTLGPPEFRLLRDSNCRSGPGTEYEVITQVPVGTRLEIVGQSHVIGAFWWNVRVGEVGCWISSDLGDWLGDLAGVPPLAAPPTATPKPPTTTPTPKNRIRFPVTIENVTSDNVCFIFIVASTESGWGSSIIPENSYLPPDGKVTFLLPGGTYNLRAEDCSDNVIKISSDQKISQEYTWIVD